MDIANLWTLQCMMFILVIAGAVLKRIGLIKDESRGIITDIVLFFFLPCNIINSFQMDFDMSILKKFAVIFAIAVLAQIIGYVCSKILYNSKSREIKRVMQYCTIVSNSGFLGLPIAQGIYGTEGLMYASICIIPIRIMMWSAGIGCFTESPDFKTVVKKIATHPCIVAVYIGLGLLIFQAQVAVGLNAMYSIPVFGMIFNVFVAALAKAVSSAAGCMTALIMVLIGSMVADVKPRDMMNGDTIFISFVRLIMLPGIMLVICKILCIDSLLSAICVLMTAMPAGSTSAVLAAKYNCDYVFATKCVVVSTLISMFTIPLWAMILG